MDVMCVVMELAEDQSPEDFEAWLRDVDRPGYARMRTLSNPRYLRLDRALEGALARPRYLVVAERRGDAEAIEAEMAVGYDDFIADFEGRVASAQYLLGTELFRGSQP